MSHSNTYPKADGPFRISGCFKLHFVTVVAALVSLAPEWAAAGTVNFNNTLLQRPSGQSCCLVRMVTIQIEVWTLDKDGPKNHIVSLDFNITWTPRLPASLCLPNTNTSSIWRWLEPHVGSDFVHKCTARCMFLAWAVLSSYSCLLVNDILVGEIQVHWLLVGRQRRDARWVTSDTVFVLPLSTSYSTKPPENRSSLGH